MSVYEGAIAPWRGEVMGKYLNKLIYSAEDFDFPIHRPIQDLAKEQYELLWNEN